MADALSLPMAEIAVLLGEGKLKARALAEEAIANHERFGAKLMAYSQWAPEHARKCADAADAAGFDQLELGGQFLVKRGVFHAVLAVVDLQALQAVVDEGAQQLFDRYPGMPG